MQDKSSFTYPIIALMVTLFFIGCEGQQNTYTGKIIEFDFASVEEVKPGAWVSIDGRKFTHVNSLREGDSTQYSLPSTYVLVDKNEDTGRKVGSPLAPRNIGLYLVRYLRGINIEEIGDDEGKYTVVNPGMVTVSGILQLTKTDSSQIVVKAPKDYPIPIRVVE